MIADTLFSGSVYWHFPVMLAIVSVVYSATRYEDWGAILYEAWRWGIRMGGFLVFIGVLLYGLAWLIG